MFDSPPHDTIAAVSTPAGAGGIAVVRVSGEGAVGVIDGCFRSGARSPAAHSDEPPRRPVARRATYGTWFAAGGGDAIDDVLVTYFPGPRSYTGEDVVEVSCHGSIYIQAAVLDSCLASGARLAQPGEFTRRAYLNGRLDLTQAEGVGDLIAAETAAAHRLARTQLGGGISRAMLALRGELIEFAALLELENDFGEEDVEFADRRGLSARVTALLAETERLLRSFEVGQAVLQGVATVIAGRPNAGKSTLLNALLGDDRAIVSPVAGTTRDTIEAQLSIEGVAFRLVDTAGIREAADEIEALGVARTMAAVERAAVLLYVWDVASTAPEEVVADLERLRRPGLEVVAVANKMDLNPYARLEHYPGADLGPERFVPVSAMNDMNLGLLRERLFAAGVGELPAPGDAVLTRARHVAALREASAALGRVGEGLSAGLGGDLLVLDLRHALHHVGEVTGEIGVDDVLDAIFAGFCIGK